MSVLETFYILFKGDTTDLKKKTDEAKKSTDDLNTNLVKTKDLGEGIKDAFFDVARYFTTIAAGAVGLSAVVSHLKQAQIHTQEIAQSSAELSLPAADLDAWSYAFKTVGGDLASLKSNLSGFRDATGAVPSVALQILPKIGETLRKMNQVQAFAYGRSLGLDDKFILLLRQWGDELPELIERQKQLGVSSQNDANQARHFTNSVNDLTHALTYLFEKINTNAFPYLVKDIREATSYIVELQGKVDPFFAKLKSNMAGNDKLSDSFGNSSVFGILSNEKALEESKLRFMKYASDTWGFFSSSAEKSINFVISLISKFNAVLDSISLHQPLSKNLASSLLGGSSSVNLEPLMRAAKSQLNIATTSPIAAQTSTSIFGARNSNQSSVVNVGTIEISTQATDANGLMGDLKDYFSSHLSGATSFFQSPVAK